jgi:ABC-type nickel/cobalt efflux system permease component RcnA
MQQFFIAIILVLGLGCWWLYSENQTLTFNNMQLEVAITQQEEAMDAMRESYEKHGESLNQMMNKNAQIEAEKNRYMDVFKRHNLNQLAIAKPGLLETKVNRGTKNVFDTIENDSRELDSLDDPSGDINPNN